MYQKTNSACSPSLPLKRDQLYLPPMFKGSTRWILLVLILAVLGLLALLALWEEISDPRSRDFMRWWRGSEQERASLITARRDACPGAPFILPADGYIGLLYEDPRGPYSTANPHQGIDIFSNDAPGQTPVYAAYDGYVRREPSWRSSLIIRVPQDPLQPDRQIWLYYTHMADREGNDYIVDSFAPGTAEIFVTQGTLLGYTGDYNGSSPRTIGVHLHFSIVRDNGNGGYANELEFTNTLDPSPYLGLNVNYGCDAGLTACTPGGACPTP